MAGVIIKLHSYNDKIHLLGTGISRLVNTQKLHVDHLTQLIERDDECAERRDLAPCFNLWLTVASISIVYKGNERE